MLEAEYLDSQKQCILEQAVSVRSMMAAFAVIVTLVKETKRAIPCRHSENFNMVYSIGLAPRNVFLVLCYNSLKSCSLMVTK